jgi:hypothetical protein
MAKANRTTSTPHRATAAKTALPVIRPHVEAMDNLNEAIDDLARTIRSLYAVDTHMSDGSDDSVACRVSLSRLLMTDLAAVEVAERKAWAVVVQRKGGAS